jgi:hypothetical protein
MITRLLFLFIFVSTLVSGCDSSIQASLFAKNPIQISGETELGATAKKFELRPALQANFFRHYVLLKLPQQQLKDVQEKEAGGEEPVVTLADGRKTKIEATLVDDLGRSYPLRASFSSAGLIMEKADKKVRDFKEPPTSQPDFPPDRKFTQLILRSELPIGLLSIEWVGNNPK